jgi:hypothetical protein
MLVVKLVGCCMYGRSGNMWWVWEYVVSWKLSPTDKLETSAPGTFTTYIHSRRRESKAFELLGEADKNAAKITQRSPIIGP